MARADAAAVLHPHTPAGQAVSAMRCGLLPHTQTAMIVHHDLAYHDYEGIATNLAERERSEEHTSELQSLMRISYAVFCLKKKRYKDILTTVCNDTDMKSLHYR